jgi:phosphoribosylaminoimidazole-succinocarboxamide synthase
LPLLHAGKVRSVYDLGDRLLLLASDRVSAFDWVLPTPIPDKGRVLTRLSAYWFDRTRDIVPNHMVSDGPVTPGSGGWPSGLEGCAGAVNGRAMLVRKARRIDFECVVRGYLAGTGWLEYAREGTLAGERLPRGLREAERLPEPRFTPARKNDAGHDENISFQQSTRELGTDMAERLRSLSLTLYEEGRTRAAEVGLILADTKFEFGWVDGELTLIDEALTPDSSRYWLAEQYRPGGSPPSLDKQFVRDWLLRSPWDRESPPPELPPEIVAATRERYLEAYRRLVGKELPS